MEFSASFTETGVKFSPPAYVQRYGAICDLLKNDVRFSGKIEKVVDFGCAELSLFHYLKSISDITTILEVDYDGELLERFQSRAEPLFYDHLFQRQQPLTVSVLKGSVSEPDYRLIGCDAVIAIELIEHLDVGVFDRLPHNVFGYIKPLVAIFTTPNADFNVLFPNLKNGGFRHLDHRFEWTREQFEEWANNIVSRYPEFSVEVSGIAPGPEGTENIGCCSQMAVFYNQHYVKLPSLDPSQVALNTSDPEASPNTSSGTEEFTTSNAAGEMYQCSLPVTPGKHISEELAELEAGTGREDLTNETQNQDRCVSVAPRGSQNVNIWDCRVWQNTLVTNYYKSIAEYQYPFFVDPRTNEQKIIDHILYYLKSFCNYNHEFYDEEQDLWRIPLSYLMSLCEQFKGLTLHQLRAILAETGYEMDAEYLIYRYFPEGSSYTSEEHQPYQDELQLQPEDEQWDVDNAAQTWEAYCQPGDDPWPCMDQQPTNNYPETYGSVDNTPEVVPNEGYQDVSQHHQMVPPSSYNDENDFNETTENIVNTLLPTTTPEVHVASNENPSAKLSVINILKPPEQNSLQDVCAVESPPEQSSSGMNISGFPQQNSLQDVCAIKNLPQQNSLQDFCAIKNLPQQNSLQDFCAIKNLSQEVCPIMNQPQQNSMQDVCSIKNFSQQKSVQDVCAIKHNSLQNISVFKNPLEQSSTASSEVSQQNSLQDICDNKKFSQNNLLQEFCAVKNLPEQTSSEINIIDIPQQNSLQEVCNVKNLSQHNSLQDVCAIENLPQQNSMQDLCAVMNPPEPPSREINTIDIPNQNLLQDVCAIENLPQQNSMQDLCPVMNPPEPPSREINTIDIPNQNLLQDVCAIENLPQQNSMQDLCPVMNPPEPPSREINTIDIPNQNLLQDVCAIENLPQQNSLQEVCNVKNISQHNSLRDVCAINSPPKQSSSCMNIVDIPQQNSLQDVLEIVILKHSKQHMLDVSGNHPKEESSSETYTKHPRQTSSLDVCACNQSSDKCLNDLPVTKCLLDNHLGNSNSMELGSKRSDSNFEQSKAFQNSSENQFETITPTQSDISDIASFNNQNRNDICGSEFSCISLASHNTLVSYASDMGLVDTKRTDSKQNASANTKTEQVKPVESNTLSANVSDFSTLSDSSVITQVIDYTTKSDLSNQENQDSHLDRTLSNTPSNLLILSDSIPTNKVECDNTNEVRNIERPVPDANCSDLRPEQATKEGEENCLRSQLNAADLEVDNNMYLSVDLSSSDGQGTWKHDSDMNVSNIPTEMCDDDISGTSASKDKDFCSDLLSDSGYMKSQDSPQSPNCSETFSNDLITPDKDVMEMTQSTILECIPENLNYVTQTSSSSPKGDNKRSSSYRRKSIGPMTGFSENKEFSDCYTTSMTRPKSLHVCMSTSSDPAATESHQDVYPPSLVRQPVLSPRNEMNRPVHRHINLQAVQINDEEEHAQQNRPNFLELQNMVAVLDHQNNNVDYEGNNIDEEEGAGRVEFEAVHLLRQRMDIHNENHMAERQNELDDGQGEEIVEEYRENYHEENYSNNPQLIAVPSLTSESLLSSHHTLQTDDTTLGSPHIQPADDMNLLRDITENTLKKSSYVDFFPNKSPCCSKTCYDLICDHRPSTSKGFSPSDNLDIERKKTGHCLETLHNIEEIYSFESGYMERASTNSNHSLLSNDSSKCELDQVSLESCLTIIGSHLHSCFSRSTSAHWDNSHVNLGSEPETILNLDIREELADCSWEEIISGQVSKTNSSCEGSVCKPSSTHTADGRLVASKTRVSPRSSSPPLVDHYSAEDQLILPHWIIRIMTESADTPFHSVPVYEEQEGMPASAPVERQAGGDGVCIHSHSYPSSHSSGHASMSSTTSHTNHFQSIMVPVERQAYSFMDIPYYRPAFRDSYQSSSSNSSIDLQLPVEVQDAVVEACQCEYCLANNSDSASHRNYMYHTQDHNLATLRPKHHTADAQDSSDDTYQSHTYLNNQTITFALNCSNENGFGKEPQKSLHEEIQQGKSPTDFKDDSEYRLIERTHQYDESPPLHSSEYFRMSILHEINLHGVSSDMSGNYADIETDLDSEPD